VARLLLMLQLMDFSQRRSMMDRQGEPMMGAL
jgi:hypothetical protein